MEHLSKVLKIFSLILFFSSVCYSVYPENRILDNSGDRDKSTTTTSSLRIDISPQPSTSGDQDSISVNKKTYEARVGENGKKTYLCNDCAYRSPFKSAASLYWYAIHGLRTYKCSGCKYEANVKSHLKQHEIVVHLGSRPFRCRLCQYEGTFKRYLTLIHINSEYLNLKEYKCTQCQYATAVKGNLKMHIERNHTDQQ